MIIPIVRLAAQPAGVHNRDRYENDTGGHRAVPTGPELIGKMDIPLIINEPFASQGR